MFLRANLSRTAIRLAIAFLLLQRSLPPADGPGKFSDKSEALKDDTTDFGRIRCPLCRWRPRASSRWYCGDEGFHTGCGTAWNTFDTRGRCPGCAYVWKWTDCLRCFGSSPHEAWYEDSAADDRL